MVPLLVVVAFAFLNACSAPKAQPSGAPPPIPVNVAVAMQETVPVDIQAIGTVASSATVQVKSQIAGELLSVEFVEGRNVNKGDLLFRIDPRPYEQALLQAEAALEKDTALLRQAEANLGRDLAQEKNASAESRRYETLAKEGIISLSVSDQYRTTADALRESVRADRAAIESARASITSDRAAIARAKLDLGYCEIRSPLSGRTGNLLVYAGNLVKANGDEALVVVNQIAPAFVSFGVPQELLPAIRQRSGKGNLAATASDQTDRSNAAHGVLTVIDNTIDANTGTIRLKATFPNQDHVLWPGQFVNVALTLDTRNNAVLVPAEAVQAGQKGQFVYIVKSDQSVEPRTVTVGPTLGRKTVIENGVAAGETLVTDGQLRLFPGARIHAVAANKLDSKGP